MVVTTDTDYRRKFLIVGSVFGVVSRSRHSYICEIESTNAPKS